MPPLDALYRRLLFTYPAGYRAEHEDEIVTTLREAAPQGCVPSLREAAGLITGGLRTRAAAAAREGARAQWVDGLRLAAVLLLACYMNDILMSTVRQMGLRSHLYPILLGVVLVMTMRGATRAALVLMAAVVPVGWHLVLPIPWTYLQLILSGYLPGIRYVAAPLVALLLTVTALLVCTVTRRHKPWSWWLVGLVVLCPLMYSVARMHEGPILYVHPLGLDWFGLASLLIPALPLSVLALVARDPRPAIAGAVFVAASHYIMLLPAHGWDLISVTLILTELLAIAAIVQSRRLLASNVPIPPG